MKLEGEIEGNVVETEATLVWLGMHLRVRVRQKLRLALIHHIA